VILNRNGVYPGIVNTEESPLSERAQVPHPHQQPHRIGYLDLSVQLAIEIDVSTERLTGQLEGMLRLSEYPLPCRLVAFHPDGHANGVDESLDCWFHAAHFADVTHVLRYRSCEVQRLVWSQRSPLLAGLVRLPLDVEPVRAGRTSTSSLLLVRRLEPVRSGDVVPASWFRVTV